MPERSTQDYDTVVLPYREGSEREDQTLSLQKDVYEMSNGQEYYNTTVYIMQEKCFPRHGGEAFPFGGKNLRSGRKCPIQYRPTILHQERRRVNERVVKKKLYNWG